MTQPVGYESLEEVLAAVEAGRAEAAVVQYPPTAYYLTNHGESNCRWLDLLK